MKSPTGGDTGSQQGPTGEQSSSPTTATAPSPLPSLPPLRGAKPTSSTQPTSPSSSLQQTNATTQPPTSDALLTRATSPSSARVERRVSQSSTSQPSIAPQAPADIIQDDDSEEPSSATKEMMSDPTLPSGEMVIRPGSADPAPDSPPGQQSNATSASQQQQGSDDTQDLSSRTDQVSPSITQSTSPSQSPNNHENSSSSWNDSEKPPLAQPASLSGDGAVEAGTNVVVPPLAKSALSRSPATVSRPLSRSSSRADYGRPMTARSNGPPIGLQRVNTARSLAPSASMLSMGSMAFPPQEPAQDSSQVTERLRTYLESGVSSDLTQSYVDAFEEGVSDDVLMIGSISMEELEATERTLQAQALAALDAEEEARWQRENTVKSKEKAARKRIQGELQARARLQIEKEKSVARAEHRRLARLQEAFRKAESQLKNALKSRKGDVRAQYGELKDDNGMYTGVKRRRYRVDWSKTPQPIQIRLDCVRAVKDKLPRGRYIMTISMFDRLGGHPMRWSKVRGQEWAGSTMPIRHTGRHFNLEMPFNANLYTVAPANPDIRPNMVFLFELYLLKGRHSPLDTVVAWGAFPVCNAAFDVIKGRFKLPLIKGAYDPSMEKWTTIESVMAYDLDNWLGNMYFEVSHLPRYSAGQKEYEVELQYTSSLLGYPERGTGSDGEGEPLINKRIGGAADEENDADTSDEEALVGATAAARAARRRSSAMAGADAPGSTRRRFGAKGKSRLATFNENSSDEDEDDGDDDDDVVNARRTRLAAPGSGSLASLHDDDHLAQSDQGGFESEDEHLQDGGAGIGGSDDDDDDGGDSDETNSDDSDTGAGRMDTQRSMTRQGAKVWGGTSASKNGMPRLALNGIHGTPRGNKARWEMKEKGMMARTHGGIDVTALDPNPPMTGRSIVDGKYSTRMGGTARGPHGGTYTARSQRSGNGLTAPPSRAQQLEAHRVAVALPVEGLRRHQEVTLLLLLLMFQLFLLLLQVVFELPPISLSS